MCIRDRHPIAFVAQYLAGYGARYTEAADRWAADCHAGPPKEVRLECADAAIGQIGPLFIAERHARQQCTDLQAQLDSFGEEPPSGEIKGFSRGGWFLRRSRVEFQLAQATTAATRASEALNRAIEHLDQTSKRSAEAISHQLVRDADAYTAAIESMSAAEPGALDRITARAAELTHVGPLAALSLIHI